MRRVFKIICLASALAVGMLWIRVLAGVQRDSLEIPPQRTPETRFQILLMSDSRGMVFDKFVPQRPPEQAPGPPWAKETELWLKPRAEQSTAAYARYFGFEKGINHRHGRAGSAPLYFYGVDYYFAVPHWFLIFTLLVPAVWPIRHAESSAQAT